MTDLFDGEQPEADMSLYEPTPVDPTKADTSSSDKNLMAQSALISGEDPVATYSQLSQMGEDERKIATMEIGDAAKKKKQAAEIEMIGQLLQNPELPWEAQAGLVQAVAQGSEKPSNSLKQTAEALYTTPSGKETESQERRLVSIGELIDPITEHMALKQQVINSFAFNEDGEAVSIGNNLGDFAELFTPLLEQEYMYNIRQKIGTGEISTAQHVMNAVMLGESKVDAREAYKAMAPDERKLYLENALETFNSIKTLNIFNDNDLIQLDNLMSIVQEGYYGTSDRVLEDIGSVLDIIPGVNLLWRAAVKPASKAAKLQTLSLLQKTGLRRTASKKQPASVQSLAEQVNPDMARAMAKDVDSDLSEEVAEVVTGTSRTEAQVEAHAPQVSTPDGSVVAKPYAMDRDILAAAYDETSRIYRSPGEIARTAEKIEKGLGEIRGLVRVDELATSPKVLDNGKLSISEVYTTPDGGFHTPQAGIKAAMQKLESYGVKEEDLTVLQKQGGEYLPVSVKDVEAKKEIVKTATEGKRKPASKEELAKVEEDFIQEKKAKLMADVSPRLDRGDRKQLLKEKKQLEESLAKVEPEQVGKPAKGKGISARKAKKDAKELATRLTVEESKIFQERLDVVNQKLAASKSGEAAEADLSRLEQGIVPSRFKEELDQRKKESGTVIEGTAKPRRELPEELQKVNMQDDYAIRIDFDYSPRAIDVTGDVSGVKVRDELAVKLNFLDSLSSHAPVPGKSTFSKFAFQASHMLDPLIVKGAVAAVDQGNRLQKVIMDKFKAGVSDPMEQLDKARAQRITKLINDQNIARKRYKAEELLDMGLDEAELSIMDNWKYVNDQHWHLSNRDANITLRNRGYTKYKDMEKGDEFIGKVMPSNVARPKTVYDPSTGKTKLTPEVWAQMEATGGKIFELKTPQVIDEVEVKHIMVRGADQGRYIKSIQEDDVTLPYIDGYSHIDYKDKFFIERRMVDENGKEVAGTNQAILTAPESTSAAMAVERLIENASDALKGRKWEYSVRNSNDVDPVDVSLKNFEVADAAGLSSQRKRGQTLKQFDAARTEDMTPNIADPLESFKHSAAELSKRVPLREFLDDLEQRIIDQYGKVLPRNEYNQPRLPKADEKLKGGDIVGTEGAKLMADARTTIEYYNYMKFGYLNQIDKGWKRTINKVSQIVGKASPRLEKGVLAVGEEVPSLIGAFKGLAFNAHIALSAPPSQWMVQGLPATMNALLHPGYISSGKVVKDLNLLKTAIVSGDNPEALVKAVGKAKADEILKLKAEWDRTGLGVGVDKHLIVETGLEGMMETNRMKPLKKVHDAVVDTGRKAGFDVGETFQLMAFWLAARNDALKANKSMDNARDFEEVRAKTRTLTMNMNKAGEMPWNKNSLSLFTQFMISPYKSLTMLLDRGLTTEERIKIGSWQALVMPLPSYITTQVRAAVGVEGSEGDLTTEVITNGLLGGAFNTALNAVYEDAGSASWQRNVQLDPTFAGPMSFVQELTKDPHGANVFQQVAQMSPGLSMVNPWGYNPIAFNLMKSFGGLIASPVMDEKDRLYAMKEFQNAVEQSTALTRGLSIAYKDIFNDTARRRYSALSGKLQDDDVSLMESFARGAFGLETTRQTVDREVNAILWSDSKEMRDDIDLIIKELNREATVLGFNMGDPKRPEYLIRNFSLAFDDGRMPPKAAAYFMSKLRPDMTLTQKLLNSHGYGSEQAQRVLDALGDSHPELKSMYNFLQSEEAVKALREEK